MKSENLIFIGLIQSETENSAGEENCQDNQISYIKSILNLFKSPKLKHQHQNRSSDEPSGGPGEDSLAGLRVHGLPNISSSR